MNTRKKGLIIYIVGKFPIGNEPKQGKYPAIFNGMLNRNWNVLMVAQHTLDRDISKPYNFSYFNNTDGALFENYLFSRWSKRIKRYIKFQTLANILMSLILKIVVKTTYDQISKYLDENKFDFGIIHVYGTNQELGPMIASLLADKYKLPIIMNVHASLAYSWTLKKHPLFYKEFLPKISFFAPVSYSLGAKWKEIYRDYINCKEEVVPNPVQPDIFDLSKTEFKNTNFTFIHVSKMDENRNIGVILDGFLHFFKINPKSELVFIGSNSTETLWVDAIKSVGAENSVKFLGRCSREEVAIQMGKAHVYVQSATVETFGNPIVESLMLGLPVIVTKSGGPESIIKDSRYGIVLDEITAESMATAMQGVFDTYMEFDKNVIRNYALAHFSEKSVFDQLEKIYNSFR